MDGPQQDIIKSESEIDNNDNNVVPPTHGICVVCLHPRNIMTVIFLPCQHRSTCQNCSDILGQIESPVYRPRIGQRLIAYP